MESVASYEGEPGKSPPDARDHGAADGEPRISRQQAHRDEARESPTAYGAPRDVLLQQPCRQCQHTPRGEDLFSPFDSCDANEPGSVTSASRIRAQTSLLLLVHGGRKRDSSSRSAAIVRMRNASHHVTMSRTGEPAVQNPVADDPACRADDEREREQRPLPAEDVDRGRKQDDASGEEQPWGRSSPCPRRRRLPPSPAASGPR